MSSSRVTMKRGGKKTWGEKRPTVRKGQELLKYVFREGGKKK